MPLPTQLGHLIKGLGVERLTDIGKLRDFLEEISGLGQPLLPEFTLHNQVHADNLVKVIGILKTECKLKLTHYEAFLLVASAYLHDLGMFVDGTTFEDDILPDLESILPFCPQAQCDSVGNYRLFGLDRGAQIRKTHNLLSGHWIEKQDPPIAGVDPDDIPYLIIICRGHSRANLRSTGCTCYRTIPYDGEEIRLGLLASLLRLADAMDFYKSRAPSKIFWAKAAAFVRNPISLEHWIKHYFVQDPFIAKANEGGNQVLKCTVYFCVPPEEINGFSYADFLWPLFEKHIQQAREWDFDLNQYPTYLARALEIDGIELDLQKQELRGTRKLPTRIVSEIEKSGCKNILDFLKALSADEDLTDEKPNCASSSSASVPVPSQPVLVVDDHPFYQREMKEILENRGYKCVLTNGVDDALRSLNECKLFALLLDLKIDGSFRNGLDVAKAAVEAGLPTIVVTNYPGVDLYNRTREIGVVRFFDKSRLDADELVRALEQIAQRSDQNQLDREERLAKFEELLGLFPET